MGLVEADDMVNKNNCVSTNTVDVIVSTNSSVNDHQWNKNKYMYHRVVHILFVLHITAI